MEWESRQGQKPDCRRRSLAILLLKAVVCFSLLDAFEGRSPTRQLTDPPEHLRPGPLLHPFKALASLK